MIAQVAEKISYFFIAKKIIKENDKDMYSYSFEIFISTLINFIVIFIIAIVFKKIPETFLYLSAFFPLRIIAGGYHAGSHLKCISILIVTYLLILLLLSIIPSDMIIITSQIMILLSSFIILLLAPIEDKNNPMTDNQKVKLQLKSRIATIVYLIIITVLLFIKPYISLVLSLGSLSVGLSLVASKIKSLVKVNATK